MLKQKSADWNTTIRELREESESIKQQADVLRDSLSGVRARHSTLTQILNDRSYTADAVQKLFAANERGGGQDFHAVGVLADYAEVEEHQEGMGGLPTEAREEGIGPVEINSGGRNVPVATRVHKRVVPPVKRKN